MAISMTPNKKNLRERADYGVRVARPGYDANKCAQNQLLFNSGWPIMQIAEVMDLSNMPSVEIYEYEIRTYSYNSSTHIGVGSTKVVSEVSEPPAGYTNTYTYDYDVSTMGEYRSLMVNRKYVKKLLSGSRTVYYYPDEQTTEGDIVTTTTKTCTKMTVGRKAHRLGFTPLFMTSDGLSNISGYAILFSIDISKDVDYPYTESALALLSPTKDYGIKSSSKFGRRVPGLCSNMFSKLVQAVKTEETSNVGDGDLHAIWSPVKEASEGVDGLLLPFEFYSFIGNTNNGSGIDGGCYYTRDYPFYISRYNGSRLEDAWAVASTAFQDVVNTKNSLIVLRSPMVSPEYEEKVL